MLPERCDRGEATIRQQLAKCCADNMSTEDAGPSCYYPTVMYRNIEKKF